MQRKTFGRKQLNSHRPRVDRFVPPRESFPEMKRRILWSANIHLNPYDVTCPDYQTQKRFMRHMDSAFDLDPLCMPDEADRYIQSWPCVPRKKSYLSSADSILDLPTYSYAAFPELLDWSNENVLVAALGKNYHKWSWRSQSLIGKGVTQFNILCCKFDAQGNRLALGTDMGRVEVHHGARNKWLSGALCKCTQTSQLCFVTAVDWSPTGNSFVTGCSRGMMMSFTNTCRLIQNRLVMPNAVKIVRVSPDARFVSAAAVSADFALVMSWPSLQTYYRICYDWTVKTVTWHPWRSALLAIGSISSADMHAQIALWDAPSGKTRESVLGEYLPPYHLDAMLFSKRTGELVLSLWDSDKASVFPEMGCSRLVVMSDSETVVDQCGDDMNGLDRVRTMVFSPDGSKLATATSDEDLIIWNFLPADPDNPRVQCRRFSAFPSYLDKVSCGMSLR